MVLTTEPVVTEIRAEVDKQSFEEGVKFARDTGKKLDQETQTTLKLNVAQFQTQLRQVNADLRAARKRNDQEAEIRLQVRVNELKDGLREARRELTNFTNTGDKNLSRFQRSINGVTDAVKQQSAGFGRLKTAFLSVLSVGAIGRFTQSLLSAGSTAEEQASKFGVIFSGIEEQATAAFNAIADGAGRSQVELQGYGAQVGALVKPLGLTSAETLALSENVVKLAIDQASFTNATDEKAIEAFTKALLGETESLKSLEISLSAAEIKQTAYNEGIAETGAELTNAQKAFATYQALVNRTALSQGDAVRTGQSFANQLKRLRGEITDVTSTTGRNLANQFAGVVGSLADFVGQYGQFLLDSVVQTASTIGGIISDLFGTIAQVFSFLTGATVEAGKEQATFAKIVAQSLLVVRGSFQLAAGVVSSFVKFIGTAFTGVGVILNKTGQIIVQTFRDAFSAVISFSDTFATNIGVAFNRAVVFAVDSINSLIDKVNSLGVIELGRISGPQRQDFQAFEDSFTRTTELASELGDITSALGDSFSQSFDGVRDAIGSIQDEAIELERTFADSAEGTEEAYDSSLNDISDLFSKYAGDAEDANERVAGSSKASADSQIKDQERIKREEERLLKERERQQQQAFKEAEQTANSVLKSIGDVVQEQTKKVGEFDNEIQKLTDSLRDVDAEIQEVGASAQQDILSRFLEVQDEIQQVQQQIADEGVTPENQQELQRLEQERQLIEANTSEEERLEAVRREGLTTTERILEDRDAEIVQLEEKRVAIEAEIAAVEAQKARELAILEDFAAKQELLEQRITERFATEVEKRQQLLSGLIQRQQQLANFAGGGPIASGSPIVSPGGTNTNSTTNFNVTQNVQNPTDAESIVRALGRGIVA